MRELSMTTLLLIVLMLLANPSLGAKSSTVNRSLDLDANGIHTLEIEAGAGSMEIKGANVNRIEVSARIKVERADDDDEANEFIEDHVILTLERHGDEAKLVSKSESNSGWLSKSATIDLEIRVPMDIDLDVDDGSGPIEIERIKGHVFVDDGSGWLKISEIGNGVKIDDGSGSIEVANVNGDVVIDDGSGEIEVKDVSGDVRVDDGSGEVRITKVHGDVSVADGSGSITVREMDGKFKLINDGSGSVHVNGQAYDKKNRR